MALIIKLVEIIVPPLLQLIVNHYSKKEQTPEVQQKLQAHQDALSSVQSIGVK